MRRLRLFFTTLSLLSFIVYPATVVSATSQITEAQYQKIMTYGGQWLFPADLSDISNGSSDCIPVTNMSLDSLSSQSQGSFNKVMAFLLSQPFAGNGGSPLNNVQAAAVLGNLWAESHFMATADNGSHRGIAQWSNPGRFSNIPAPSDDLDNQIRFIQTELDGSYLSNMGNFWGLSSSDQLKEATFLVARNYEVAIRDGGGPTAWSNDFNADRYLQAWTRRRDYAIAIYNKLNEGGNSVSDSCGATAYANDGFVIYDQFDARWKNVEWGRNGVTGSIGDTGCGPTSFAMIATALLGRPILPTDTANIAGAAGIYHLGVGSSWEITRVLSPHYGLQTRQISHDEIDQYLRNGWLIHTSGKGASPFTSGGHYIVIRGISANNQWEIGDSNGQKGIANSKHTWDKDDILVGMALDNIWAVKR